MGRLLEKLWRRIQASADISPRSEFDSALSRVSARASDLPSSEAAKSKNNHQDKEWRAGPNSPKHSPCLELEVVPL